ncbi:peptidylprolyl isomerase [Pseudoalteromonas sp. SSDWG2]|uniref:peptidylprolyl isomerase n=1 Tax=Pseudoalteromonas sp. SSDWG2 TaxID=3139391 RepID=UPI003BABE9B6
MKNHCIAALMMTLALSSVAYAEQATPQSPTEIIDTAPASDWRKISPHHMLILSLPTGDVYFELNEQLAPKHYARMKELTQKGFYKGLSMYRFVEGFVAQGGAGEQETEVATLTQEFVSQSARPVVLDMLVNQNDGYSARSGFLNGFAVAQNEDATQTWQIHCIGALGMARGNDVNSATSEFYVVIGHAPRYLDRNITVFGRVIAGMEHLQKLQRPGDANTPFNPITDMRLASQLPEYAQPNIKVMRTDSASFEALVEARKNRPEQWFITTPDYIDTCAMQVPSVIGD